MAKIPDVIFQTEPVSKACWPTPTSRSPRDSKRGSSVSRSVTDFHYCCYLSDLAVDAQYQRQSIGAALIRETRAHLQPTCRLLLLSTPGAGGYYPKIGFERHPQAWTMPPSGGRVR